MNRAPGARIGRGHERRARSAVKVGARRWSATTLSSPRSRARSIILVTKLPPFEALPCKSVEARAVRTTSASGA